LALDLVIEFARDLASDLASRLASELRLALGIVQRSFEVCPSSLECICMISSWQTHDYTVPKPNAHHRESPAGAARVCQKNVSEALKPSKSN
jgi:hypothetical protein